MVYYASRTGTRRNLNAMREVGMGLLISASGSHRAEGFDLYALDNGAWSAFRSGKEWDPNPFLSLLRTHGASAQWAVLPDIVGGGRKSLARSLEWASTLAPLCRRWLLPVQDGMRPDQVLPHLTPNVGVFLGGSTEWKLRTMATWGALTRVVGCYFHVGRVNTVGRLRLAQQAGAHSCDGSGPTRFAVEAYRLAKHINPTNFWEWPYGS